MAVVRQVAEVLTHFAIQLPLLLLLVSLFKNRTKTGTPAGPQDSWSVTEPSTGYQAGWIRLVSKFVGSGSCSILPVKLTSFTAMPIGLHTASLNWQTAVEKQNKEFIIERSTDGISFTEIGKVEGNGNSTSLQSYNYMDLNVQEKILYYRLIQVDLNGTKDYSEVRTVDFSDERNFIRIYPNPTLGNAVLEYELRKSENPILVKMTDVSGKELLIRPVIQTNNSRLLITLESGNLPPGIYFVHLITNENVLSAKLIKE